MNLHHPAVESVLLPLLVALLVAGLARALIGPRRGGVAAGLGVGIALIAATVWMSGWPTAPAGAVARLPWIFAAAALAGLVAAALHRRPGLGWLVGAITAVAALAWLDAAQGGWNGALTGAIGALLLAALLRAPAARADAAAALVIASLGLAAATLIAGSLALFQHALVIAAATGGVALWVWPRPRLAFGPAAVVTATIAWLATAQAAIQSIGLGRPVVALLGLALLVPLLTRRGADAAASGGLRAAPITVDLHAPGTVSRPLLAAAIAFVCAAAAIGWLILAPADMPGKATKDDPYLD